MKKYCVMTPIVLASALLLTGCSTPIASLPTQTNLDLEKYMGIWYEQALLPNRFQKECVSDVSAEYIKKDAQYLQVTNQCRTADGSMKTAMGLGRLNPAVEPPNPAVLEVRFAPDWLSWVPMIWGDYWVIKVQDNYQYSLVGTPDREYLWVLSRDKNADSNKVKELLNYAKSLNFDVSKVEFTHQQKE